LEQMEQFTRRPDDMNPSYTDPWTLPLGLLALVALVAFWFVVFRKAGFAIGYSVLLTLGMMVPPFTILVCLRFTLFTMGKNADLPRAVEGSVRDGFDSDSHALLTPTGNPTQPLADGIPARSPGFNAGSLTVMAVTPIQRLSSVSSPGSCYLWQRLLYNLLRQRTCAASLDFIPGPAEAAVAAHQTPAAAHRSFEACGPEALSQREVVALFEAATGRTFESTVREVAI
jgi:hypothetical protein